ncbi:MAG: TonB-dependent receptor [Rhizomicrobium sp.]
MALGSNFTRYFNRELYATAAMTAAMLAILPVAAQADPIAAAGQVETVTVTARKVSESLQSVPASVSALSAADLHGAGVSSFSDLITQVPNVSFGGGIAGSLQGQLGIRGVSTLERNIGIESGVGIYVDGVYQGRSDNYNQELIDVSQVEVLRGPQGTLFGKNTVAGVFNITTMKPTDQFEGEARAEVGNYGLVRAQGYAMGPLSDTVGGKISLGYVSSSGTYKNLNGGPDGDALNLMSYRGSLYYTPTDKMSFALSVDGLHDRGRPAYFQVTDLPGLPGNPMATQPHTIEPDGQDYLHRDNYGISLTGTIDLDFATLTSISAYRMADYHASLDDDQSPLIYLSKDIWSDKTKFFSQELRLNGDIGSDLSYVAGAYYFSQTVSTSRELDIGSGFGIPGNPPLYTLGAVTTNTYAIFANLDYRITGALTLSGGLRYSAEGKNAGFDQEDPSGIFALLSLPSLSYAKKVTNYDLSPMGSLSYQVMPDIMTYVRVAQGYKSSAFNIDLVGSTNGLFAGPEHATTYEGGVKTELFDNSLRANFAVFDTEYENMQVSQLLGSGVTLNNAGAATIKGAEAELVGYVTDAFKLEGSLGYLDAHYTRYQDCSIPASLGGGTTDCSGNRIIGAPAFTFQAAGEYTYPISFGTLIGRLEYTGQSPVYYEATNSKRFETDTRNIVNARLSLVSGDWEATLWGKNLMDEVYTTYHDDRSTVGVLQTTAYGDPRTYGISVALHF